MQRFQQYAAVLLLCLASPAFALRDNSVVEGHLESQTTSGTPVRGFNLAEYKVGVGVTVLVLVIGIIGSVIIKRSYQSEEAEESKEQLHGAGRKSKRASLVIGAQGDEGVLSNMEGDECETEQTKSGLSQFDVTANFAIAALGAGVVVFPRVMADTGYIVATCLLMTASIAACICGLVIVQCCDMAERVAGSPKGSLTGYEAMAEAALGAKGKYALTFSKNLFFMGIIIVYFTFETDALGLWLPKSVSAFSIRWFIVLPVFLGLALLRDLKAVAKFAIVGIIAAVCQTLGLCGGGLFEIFLSDRPGAPPKTYLAAELDIAKMGAALSTFVFGFGCIATLPSIRSQMTNADELPGALKSGLCIVVLVYMSVMWIGYMAFADRVDSNMILSIGGSNCQGLQCAMGSISALSIILNLVISMPTFAFCINSAFENAGIMFTPLSPLNIVCRASLIIAMCFVSYKLSYAQQIISILSAIFAVCNNFLFPIGCYHGLLKQDASVLRDEQAEAPPTQKAGVLTYTTHGIVAIIGLATMIFGVKGGITSLLKAMEAPAPA